MNCPNCLSDRPMLRNGRTKAGNQRWRCLACGHTLTHGGTHGGYRHGTPGSTSTNRMRRLRKKKKDDADNA